MKTAFLVSKLFDGRSEGYQEDVAILVENNIIQKIVSKADVPNEYTTEDLGDLFVVPGLFDCHVHLTWTGGSDVKAVLLSESHEKASLRAAEHARLSLLHGVTTIRDAGGHTQEILAVRDAIEEKIVRGSRIIASGSPIVMTGGHCDYISIEVDGPHEALKAVRTLMKQGVDFIKVMATGGIQGRGETPEQPQMTVEELTTIVEEAHKKGLKVAAHAEGLQGIKNALEAGVDTIEHGNFMDQEVAHFMAENQVFVVPTMSTFYYKATFSDNLTGVPPHIIQKAKEIVAGTYNVINHVKEYGVPLAAGTDCGATRTPHGAVVYELELYVHAGLTPYDSLLSATTNAARACGVDDKLGTIEPGKIADFIGVKGDPLERISSLRNVDTVVKDGKIEKRNGSSRDNSENDLSLLKIID
jgi:imidazolonepropionase-like amidohydrolase